MTFKLGQSGNPNGRPVGTSDKRTELRKLLQEHASALVNKAVEMALGGDPHALRLCLERIVPKAKNEPIHIAWSNGKFNTAQEVLKSNAEVLAAVANSSLSPEQGRILSELLDRQRKIIETVEIEERVCLLEKTILDQ